MAVRFGIVGCGMIADFHAKALTDLSATQLIGCSSRSQQSAEAFAEKHGCKVHDSLESMLGDEAIDAVSICTPSGAHMEPAVAAANAGKHIIIEKPLEVSLDRCDQIIAACKENNVVLSTIFQSRFHKSSCLLKEAVESGRFGRVTLANAYVKWFRTQEYYDSGAWRGTWQLDGGGALMNQAIHNVDLLQWIMGPVAELNAYSATLAHERIEVEDTVVANLRFSNGALGTIEATTAAWPGSLKRLEIYGSAGSAIVEDDTISKWDFAEPHATDKEILEQFSSGSDSGGGASDPSAIDYSGHKSQFQDIARAITDGGSPLIDGLEARKSVEIISAIYRSASTGASVKL